MIKTHSHRPMSRKQIEAAAVKEANATITELRESLRERDKCIEAFARWFGNDALMTEYFAPYRSVILEARIAVEK